MADDAVVTIGGTLTTDLGALESGHGAFVEDATGGIAIYLDVAGTAALPMGTAVTVRGSIDDRFAQRTLRATAADIHTTGTGILPAPHSPRRRAWPRKPSRVDAWWSAARSSTALMPWPTEPR
jgi:hypothetical protein